MLGNKIAALGEHRWKPLLLHLCFWIGASVVAALHAWSSRSSMNEDGISYLDIADAYMNGDWNAAITGHWSPLYSWLIGAAMYVLKPSSYWEYPVVHLVNFVIYLLSLGCFTFLLSELIHYQHNHYAFLSDWVWVVIGYCLFIWASIDLVGIAVVTPDQCVAAFVYLAVGLLIRIKRKAEASNLSLFVFLGLVVGFGYLAKAAMFPLAFVFLTSSFSLVANLRRNVLRVATALTAFSLIAVPFILALSISKGRLTFGDAGKLNYAIFVGGTKIRHWRGENPTEGVPKHTPRQIFAEPTVYEFETPIKATYAPWYDPSYWFEGLKIQFSLAKQIRTFKISIREYVDIVFQEKAILISLIIGSAILCLMGWNSRKKIVNVAIHWQLIAPAIAAFAMYALVHVETRYVAPFIVICCLGIFLSVIVPASLESTQIVTFVSSIMFALMLIKIGVPTARLAYAASDELLTPKNDSDEMWGVADGLHRMGIQAGDRVAIIGWGSQEACWARLARVKIVAEIPASRGWGFFEDDKFWNAKEAVKVQVYQALAEAGAKIIVARVPDSVSPNGWQKIQTTAYSAHLLP